MTHVVLLKLLAQPQSLQLRGYRQFSRMVRKSFDCQTKLARTGIVSARGVLGKEGQQRRLVPHLRSVECYQIQACRTEPHARCPVC